MNILALDTATEACTVALLCDGDITERFQHAPQQQAKLILPMVDELMVEAGLKPAQLDALAFGRGPGSFTGLRIAAAVVQGIAFAADLPVLPVSTLACLAQTAYRLKQHNRILAALDARMNEVYWAYFEIDSNGIAIADSYESVTSVSNIALQGKDWFLAGNGYKVIQEQSNDALIPLLCGFDANLWPHARDMIKLASVMDISKNAVPAYDAIPVYIRDNVAKKKSLNSQPKL